MLFVALAIGAAAIKASKVTVEAEALLVQNKAEAQKRYYNYQRMLKMDFNVEE